jgi:hypothetical protein
MARASHREPLQKRLSFDARDMCDRSLTHSLRRLEHSVQRPHDSDRGRWSSP